MGQQVIVTLTDDLDGSEADEKIMFALDGASYEIDLNAKNAAGLRKALDKYVTAARKPSRPTAAVVAAPAVDVRATLTSVRERFAPGQRNRG